MTPPGDQGRFLVRNDLYGRGMSEAVLFSPYGSTRDFVVDGTRLGVHQMQMTGGVAASRYWAQVAVPGVFPRVRIGRLGLASAGTSADGPSVRVGLPLKFSCRTTGWGFFDDVLIPAIAQRIRLLDGRIEFITLEPQEDGTTSLELVVNDVEERFELEVAIQLVHAWVDALAAQEGRTWLDAEQAMRSKGAQGMAQLAIEDIETLESLVVDGTQWLSGQVERVGETLEARVQMLDAENSQSVRRGTLRFIPHDGDPAVLRIDAALELPPVAGDQVRLEPDDGGLWSWVKRRFELVVEDEAVDEAFLIFGEPEVKALLTKVRPWLLELASVRAKVEVRPEQLLVSIPQMSAEAGNLGRAIEYVGLLWRDVIDEQEGRAFEADEGR